MPAKAYLLIFQLSVATFMRCHPSTPSTKASQLDQTGKTEQAASSADGTLIKHIREFARDEGPGGQNAWRRLKAYPRQELVSSLTNIRKTTPENNPLHVDIAFVLCNLDYEYDPNRQFIVTVFKKTNSHALGEERLLSRLIRRGDHQLLPVLFSAASRSDGALSEGLSDTFAEHLRSDPGKFLLELKGESLEVRRKVYNLLDETVLSEDDLKSVSEYVSALPRGSAIAPVARELLASLPKPQQ